MRQSFCILIACLCSIYSTAQQSDLKGIVSIHNSGYNSDEIEYLDNVLISAPFSKSSISDANGQFQLTLVGIPNGTGIKLSVEKQGYEIVNSNELENVVLGRKSNVHIYLIEKGGLIAAQLELLSISKTALYHRRDSIIQVLRSDKVASDKMIKDLEVRFQRELVDREDAENMLNKRVADLEKQLPAFTLTLAKQNLDFASELYKTAYAYFLRGEIEKVKKLLNNQTLSEITKDGENHLENAKTLKEQSEEERQLGIEILEENIRNYEFRAEMNLLSFDYIMAIEAYDSILVIMEQNDFDDLRKALAYDASAQLQFQLLNQLINREIAYDDDFVQDMTDQMLDYQLKALNLGQQSLSETDHRLATLFSHSGKALMEYTNQDHLALGYFGKVIGILASSDTDDPLNKEMIDATVETASFLCVYGFYLDLEKEGEELIELGKECYDMAITFCGDLDSPEQQLARIYSQKATEFWLNQEEVEYCLKRSNALYKEVLDPFDPVLAKSYLDLYFVSQSMKPEEKLVLLKKILSIFDHVKDASTYDFYFQSRIESLHQIAMVYQFTEDYDSAEVYHFKYIEAFEKESYSDFDWFSRYDLIIGFYKTIGDHQKVIDYNHKYLSDEKTRVTNANWHDLHLDYLVDAHRELKNYDSVSYYLSELIDLSDTVSEGQTDPHYYYYKVKMAQLNLQLGNYSEALNDAEAPLKYYDGLEDSKGYAQERVECHSIFADAHEKLGEYDLAILHLEEMKKLRRTMRKYNDEWRMERKNDKKRIKLLK